MDPKSLSADFRDFLKSLNDHGVEYLLIGGHAVAYYGYVRPTQDMDVWIAISPENAARMVAAVESFFGCKLEGLSPEWFVESEQVTRFGVRPNLIEILTRIDGADFKAAYTRRVTSNLDGVQVNVIALTDLKSNKRASARNKDLADLDNLP
jgi:predicted nucleotidyltransferase